MNSFLKRSLSGLVYVILFSSAILLSEEFYVILTSLFAVVCIWEYTKIIKLRNPFPYIAFIGLLLLIFFDYGVSEIILILLLLNLTGSLQLTLFLFDKKGIYPSSTIQKIDISIRYIVLSFGFLVLLPLKGVVYNEMVVFSLVLFIWTNDSFAYLIGKNFGKRKLFERVSPKKTIEGFVGGVVFTIIVGLVISYYSDLYSLHHWIMLSLLTSILGTIGDLVESKFKRQAKVKDSGTIMPGHGGLLDRLDSLLFVAPFVYLYIHFIIQ